MNTLRFIKPWPLLALAALLTSLFLLAGGPAKAAPKAPHFALPSPGSKNIIDLGNYSKKVVLINFFATWCPPCRKEIKSLIELQNEFGPQGFTVIGISLDDGSSRDKIVAKFIEKSGINYPVAMGNDKVAHDYGDVQGIPQSFLVDREGFVVKGYPGYFEHDIFKKDIEELLKTKKETAPEPAKPAAKEGKAGKDKKPPVDKKE